MPTDPNPAIDKARRLAGSIVRTAERVKVVASAPNPDWSEVERIAHAGTEEVAAIAAEPAGKRVTG